MNGATTVLVSLLFVLCSPEQSLAQQPECDKQCISEVRGMLQASYQGVSTSWGQKANRRLGDKAGVAILKIYRGRALYKPDNIRTFLPVIREAFKDQQMIEGSENKKPVVTLRLLRRLQRRIRDHFLHQEITGTLNVVCFTTEADSPESADKPD